MKPTWRIYEGSLTNFPQTEEATWMNSEMFQPNKKEVQLPWRNFQIPKKICLECPAVSPLLTEDSRMETSLILILFQLYKGRACSLPSPIQRIFRYNQCMGEVDVCCTYLGCTHIPPFKTVSQCPISFQLLLVSSVGWDSQIGATGTFYSSNLFLYCSL